MKRKLFLTGPMGCGKSTAIARALGKKKDGCNGFLTGRVRDEAGHAQSFYLQSPDGSRRETFLDFSTGKPVLYSDVFSELGTELLQPCMGNVGIAPYVLDEIGGIELLNPPFAAALETVLKSDVPILGVLKGEGPAGALIRALNLTEEYDHAARTLRSFLQNDPDTLVYECGTYDPAALALAENWVKEYCP